MPAQYLQRINVESVEEVGVDTVLPGYQQIVHVVEVVDQNGDPWVPGPPVEDLKIADNGGANWANDNDYEIAKFDGAYEDDVGEWYFNNKDFLYARYNSFDS